MRGMIWTMAGLALLGLPAVASATGTTGGTSGEVAQEDPRWLPWIGCWESENQAGDDDSVSLVCVSHLAEAEGVEIATWVDGEVVAREELRSDGLSVPVQEGGCEGEQWAEWSEDGTRLFLHSQMACGEGVTRTTKGVLAIQDSGRRWLEIHAVAAGDTDPVLGVTSFRAAREETVTRAGVQAPDEGRRLAVSTARTLAARALEPDDVSEAVHEVGSEVTRALIVEAGQPFRLDAATLRALKADGVPEDVLDVMVAVTYPERFAIQGGTQDPEYAATRRAPETARAPTYQRSYSYAPFSYRSSFYYGYSPYGYAYGGAWGYPRGYWGAPVIIVQPPTVQQRGRVDRATGYTGPASRPAARRGDTQAAPAPVRRPNALPSPGTMREAPPTRATPARATPARAAPAPRPAAPRVTPPSRTSGSEPERRARPRTGGGGG